MKWLPLLLAFALTASAQVPPSPPMPTNATKAKLVSPKYAEHVVSLAPTFHVKRVKDLGAAKLILYQPTSKTSKLAIPGRKGIVPFAAPVPSRTLVWYYPPNLLTNVYFEVWHSTDLSIGFAGFTLVAMVDSTNYTIPAGLAQEFFIVRATDTNGVHSIWNVP